MKVERLKVLIYAKIGLPIEYQQLHYSGKQLEDGKLLGDYPTLESGATIFLVGRLLGGARSARVDPKVPRRFKECPIMLIETECVKMPCGHYMSPDAVMHCAKSEIRAKQREVCCPIATCKKEWSIDVLKRYGGASRKELHELEEGLSKNYCDTKLGIVQCPGCSSYCTRVDSTKKRMECPACTKRYRRAYRFCYICLHEWTNFCDEYNCGNIDCDDKKWRKSILQHCPDKVIAYSKCPSIRQCPNPKCKLLIQHTRGCKHMYCASCKTGFCFICLRKKVAGKWSTKCGQYNTRCTPAPRQV